MKGRKPDPRRLRLLDGAGEGQLPPGPPSKGKRPSCPTWFSPGQRKAFASICRRLDQEGLLATADEADIRALAIAEERLRVTTEFIEENELTYEVVRGARPYRCPACKGAGVRPGRPSPSPVEPARLPPQRGGGPGRPCSICRHPEVAAITEALARGERPGTISREFRVGRDAVVRHRATHFAAQGPPAVSEAGTVACPACGGSGVREGKAQRMRFQHPEVTHQRDAIDRVLRLSAELGLSPTSRVRVKGKLGGQKAPTGLQELMSRRGNLRK
jgi:phage terminase small subunit